MRSKWSSIKLAIEEICKNVNQCQSSYKVWGFWKIEFFFIKYIIYINIIGLF